MNKLAQEHSDDMAANMYSGHENREGKDSNERAKEMGIKTLIGENVVVDESIEAGQSKLDRSPAHLRTTINLNWESVGIGISLDKNGDFYITQDFSTRDLQTNPLSEEEIRQHKNEIQKALKEENGVDFVESKELSRQMRLYARMNRLNPFMLNVILQRQRIFKKKIEQLTFIAYGKNFVEYLKDKGYLTAEGFSRFGVALIPRGTSLRVNLVYY